MNLQEAKDYVGNPKPYSEELLLEAGLVLVRNRDQLTHRIFFHIPNPEALTTNRDPKWNEIKEGSTGERCNCGNCRTIWPVVWPEFEEKEEVVLQEGQEIYVVPERGTYKDTMASFEVIKGNNGQLMLAFLNDPYSDSMDLSLLLSGRKGYSLEMLAVALAKQNEPARFNRKFPKDTHVDKTELTIVTIKAATPDSVTLGIGKGYITSKNPETDFPVAIHNELLNH